jgi:hypothetical protein
MQLVGDVQISITRSLYCKHVGLIFRIPWSGTTALASDGTAVVSHKHQSKVPRSRTKIGILPGFVAGMRLQPLTCHKSTKSHGGACLGATHVPALQQAHNAIVATAASRCAQLVGMTVRMFGLDEAAATITCRRASHRFAILGHPPSGPASGDLDRREEAKVFLLMARQKFRMKLPRHPQPADNTTIKTSAVNILALCENRNATLLDHVSSDLTLCTLITFPTLWVDPMIGPGPPCSRSRWGSPIE